MGFFVNHIYFIPVVTWGVAVIFKGVFSYLAKDFSYAKMLGSGGMPSVHSALVTSLATAIGIKYGITSDLFTICLVFSMIIIYDAINVRFEAGLHARALNNLKCLKDTNEQYEFNESIGHLPQEAFVGSCIGIITSMILLNL